jgi:hypothetical protein
MRTDIAELMAKCDICRRIKAEHQRPAGLLKPLDIPMLKPLHNRIAPDSEGQ